MEMLEERAGCKYSKGVGICWGHCGCQQRPMWGPGAEASSAVGRLGSSYMPVPVAVQPLF